MTNPFVILSVALVCVVPSMFAQSFSLEEYKAMNVEQKRSLFIGTETPELSEPQQFLDLFVLGLNDPDQIVRRGAMQKLAMTMVALQQVKRERSDLPVNLSKIGEVQALVASKLSDPDSGTRGAAVRALAYSGSPNGVSENALLNQLAVETDERARESIIETMAFAGYDSERFKGVLYQTLGSGGHEEQIAATRAVAIIKPANALPVLAAMLQKREGGATPIIEAIAAYGKEAEFLIPELEKLMNDPAAVVDRHRVAQIIASIRDPKGSVPVLTKTTAIALADSPPLRVTPTPSASANPAASVAPVATPVAAKTPTVQAPAGGPTQGGWRIESLVGFALLVLIVMVGVSLRLRR